jgi:hypothetical protein
VATFNRFRVFTTDLAQKVHNLAADDLRFLLSNDAPAAANAVRADLPSELSPGNGYPANGIALTNTSVAEEGTSGVAVLSTDDLTLTASGGSVGPFRFVILFNNTPAGGPLIGWYDRGSSLTLADGDVLQLDSDQSAGLLRIGAAS